MDVGKNVIARALADRDASPFVKAGLGLGWLGRDESAAVFEGQSANAWKFILRHAERHGRVPSRELFEKEHPPGGFRLPPDPLTAPELIELAHNETGRVVIQTAQVAIQDVFTRSDFTQGDTESVAEARGILEAAAEKLRKGATAGRTYRMASLDELLDLPEPEPLIEGVLDLGTVVMLSGPSGAGKSFAALDWALCIASGRDWLGRPARQGSVIYVAAEGYISLGHRGKAWKREFGKVPRDSILFVTEPVQLDDEGTAWLAELTREREADLVVIDTHARCTVGMEENSATEMGLVVDRLYRIRDAIEEAGTTVLDLHHSGYEGARARGSSALKAGMDGAWDITGKEPDPHEGVTLHCSKRKDGEPFRDITVRLREAGASCVLEEADLQVDGPMPSTESLMHGDIGKTVKELAAARGVTEQAVEKELKKLEKAGKVRCEARSRGGYLWYRQE